MISLMLLFFSFCFCDYKRGNKIMPRIKFLGEWNQSISCFHLLPCSLNLKGFQVRVVFKDYFQVPNNADRNSVSLAIHNNYFLLYFFALKLKTIIFQQKIC